MPSKKTTPQPEAVPAQPKPRSAAARTPTPLTDLQALICDEVADILAHGGLGDSMVTKSLLTAAAHHHWHRWSIGLTGNYDSKRDGEFVSKMGLRSTEEWLITMNAHWLATREAPAEEKADPKTAAERIRARVLDDLAYKCHRFQTQATPEERDFMREALALREGEGDSDQNFQRLAIGEVLDGMLNRQDMAFLRVPENLRSAMQAHLKLLVAAQSCNDKAAA